MKRSYECFFIKTPLKGSEKRVICTRAEIADKQMLHHDNAPCHTFLFVSEFFTSKDIPVIPQPRYSPGLSPVTHFFFLNLNILFLYISLYISDQKKSRLVRTYIQVSSSCTTEILIQNSSLQENSLLWDFSMNFGTELLIFRRT